ncbi:MAG: choice-of-anchor D domain-containing protein [Pseudomonadota bacterium]
MDNQRLRPTFPGLLTAAVWVMMQSAGTALADELTPCDPDAPTTALAVGDIFSCEFDAVGDTDVFTLEASAPERYRLTLVDRDNAAADPVAELFDCVGTSFDFISTPNQAGASLEFDGPCTGTVSVLVSDSGNNEIGSYHIALQRLSPLPPETVEVCVDCEVEASLSPAGDSDVFSFEGTAGTTVIFSASDRDNAAQDTFVDVRLPNGDPLLGLVTPNFSGTRATATLDSTGTYTLIASDIGDSETGNYTVAAQQLFPLPPTAISIGYDETIVDTISPIADSDIIAFTGVSGDTIRITATDLDNAALDPFLEVYGPDGVLITTLAPPNNSGTFVQLSLTQTGTYTMAMFDSGINETGSYSVNLQCIFGSCFGAPDIDVVPDRVNFGTVDVDDMSAPRTIQVSNVGDADLVITITLQSSNPAFTLSNDTCSLAVLAPGGQCSFDAVFAPSLNGRAIGVVSVVSNDEDEPDVRVLLIGTGANAPPVDPVGGEVFGATVATVSCTNQATGQTVLINDGLATFDCVAAGLQADPADPIRIIILGNVD